MWRKIGLVFCAQVLLIQTISAQCIGAYNAYGNGVNFGAAPMAAPCGIPIGPDPLAAPWGEYGPAAFPASNGGGFVTASFSPLIPTGVSVLSENTYEGVVAVGGVLPFLGTVAIDGALPTTGAGAIAYGCGNGAVRITAEDMGGISFAGVAGPLGYGSGLTGPFSYGLDLDAIGYGPGCGCGATYY